MKWLTEKIAASNATWKLIVSSVPMSIPTGYQPENGRDGWANFDQDTGFERELLELLRALRTNGERNVVFITTDAHLAEVFRYTPFTDTPGFTVYEFVVGPLNAGISGNREYDTTLNPEVLFFYAPEHSPATYAEAKPWFNFGVASVGPHGRLTVSIRNVSGSSVFELTLDPR
jgi:alkaline phosphatase D